LAKDKKAGNIPSQRKDHRKVVIYWCHI